MSIEASPLRKTAIGLGSLAVGLIFAFPFLWMAKTALESPEQLTHFPPAFLPDTSGVDVIFKVFRETQLLRWMANSLVVSGVSAIVALLIGMPAAYALSRFPFYGRGGLNLTILATQMMPPIVLIIPLYSAFIGFGLADTLLSVIVANTAFALPVTVWMMKSIFDTVPFEIDEAARVDGASWLYILSRLIVPLSLPGIVACVIFAFLNAWDEYMLARTLLRSADNWVATIGLSSMMGEYVTPWNEIMAAAMLFTIPPVILFLCVQRYFVAGLGSGAVKG